MEAASLYYKEGSSDKVYHTTIEQESNGYVVNFAYGRRGSALKTGSKTSSPVSLEKAKEIFNKLLKEKLGKGYKYMDAVSGSTIPTVKDLPDTPTEMQCVLLNPIDQKTAQELLNHPDWVVQEKFDGVRFMLNKKNGQIAALNRKGKVVSVPNNIAKEAESLSNCLLDGELIGENLYVFDILEFEDNCVRNKTLKERMDLLRNLLKSISNNIIFVDIVKDNKTILYEKLLKENKEGIVFKNINAKYNVGRPASGGNYLKHKFYETCSCVVSNINDKRSVALSLFSEGKVVSVGNVTIPINFDIPNKDDVVEVKYLYAYKGGSLYQPIYLGKRSDINKNECVLHQLKYKPE